MRIVALQADHHIHRCIFSLAKSDVLTLYSRIMSSFILSHRCCRINILSAYHHFIMWHLITFQSLFSFACTILSSNILLHHFLQRIIMSSLMTWSQYALHPLYILSSSCSSLPHVIYHYILQRVIPSVWFLLPFNSSLCSYSSYTFLGDNMDLG